MHPALSLKPGAEDPKKDEAENQKTRERNKVVEATRKAFAERWRMGDAPAYPEKCEDTELCRKWQLFFYEQVADFMNGTATCVKAAYPKTKTVTNLIAGDPFNNRARWGVAHDIIGWNADIDYLGTDPYHTQEDEFGVYTSAMAAKSLIAGNRKRQTVVSLNGPWGWEGKEKQPLTFEVYPPISVIGSVVGTAAQGCQAFAFWRYYNIVAAGYDKPVEQAFGMLDAMAAWGSRKASIPKAVAVLRSRASEDWWQLKYSSDFSKDEILPYVHYYWIAEFLLRKGYPFELFYLDQPDSHKNLSDYKLVVLPFPYSVGEKALARIAEAAEAGSKIIATGARGETDELGNARAEPLLKKLIDGKKIEFIDADIASVGHFLAFDKAFKEKVDTLLGDRKPLDLDSRRLDIQAGCLEKTPFDKLITLINWSGKDTAVDLGLNMPSTRQSLLLLSKDVRYKIHMRGGGWRLRDVDGRPQRVHTAGVEEIQSADEGRGSTRPLRHASGVR